MCVCVVAGVMVHLLVFCHCGGSCGGFAHGVVLQDGGHQLGIVHKDAASCGLGYLTAHAGEEWGLGIELGEVAGISIEEVGGDLNDGTEFEGS